ncbi:MAG TPA: DUF222 domain-containing protein [Kofleriaceae bacterium]|nr:DUF222 domain-containing protein [Kofleriaceae bacterium]
MSVMVNVMDRPGDTKRAAMRALGDLIADEAAHFDAAMHTILTHIREFDAGSGWGHAGAQSCAHWLSWRVGWSLGTGREHVRVARRLGELPLVDEALRLGKLSYAKVRAITRVATARTEELLLNNALVSTGAQLETICRKLRAVQRLSNANVREVDEDRKVTRRDLDDGMVRIEATLRPEEAAIVMAAIEQHAKRAVAAAQGSTAAHGSAATDADRPADVSAGTRRPRFDRADALVSIAQAVLRGDRPDCSPVEVVLTIPREALESRAAPELETLDKMALVKPKDVKVAIDQVGVFADGTCVPAETARRLTCDCGIVEMVEDEQGNPLSVGRRTRTLSAALWRALSHRDSTCRFPGCTNHLFTEAHHIKHWAHGGETELENLCRFCTRHHVFVHEYKYRVELVDGVVLVYDPQGRRVTQEGPRIAPSSVDAWNRLRGAHEDLGISSATNAPRWNGLPVQYDLVVNGLARREGLGADAR